MKNYKENLINSEEAFHRETYEIRMAQYGFKNIERMEKFLWDLELFLQIKNVLGDRIVLKGGAATQFYLPVLAQRTSVDIDMIFSGTVEEIEDALNKITEIFKNEEGLFEFRKHIPKNPKTSLPLYTYHVNVPSVLTLAEMRSKDEDQEPFQELKIEFIMQDNKVEYQNVKADNIFAVSSELEYQILPINYLFADKLTTLGPNTIGVQDDRIDEQIKQFYDIWMLTKYHIDNFDIELIRDKYVNRAIQESKSRLRKFDLNEIKEDVIKQLYRFSFADGGEDVDLKKAINDFNALYLNAKVVYNPQIVACGAELIKLMYETILEGEGWDIVKTALYIDKLLDLDGYIGKEKGQKSKELRSMFIDEFASHSAMKPEILKGKKHHRIFWSVVDKENIYRIKEMVEDMLEINGICVKDEV
ncbi:MAG: nucleotidyl transferase AbiEii/AbiGii toxin family protein [Sedimentibacter sp.]|uniref:nucleotidyl transferase AbiEii/AbiGii toxin family protein n=1 Tax=Sedimentibacter sp. TaxID=1960295 RepID=UPI0029829511|nr:nucleotidyl transferase AbiEii/AbiGii toxin family protein [Sedimentibacter sp.]MDW5300645.1 nucleotidyl transferase AbiEii/AbiGii toxin family protein [Sedimentibacter sp.]